MVCLLCVLSAARIKGYRNVSEEEVEIQLNKQFLLAWWSMYLFQNLSEKLSEQEMQFRRLTQEQLDNFTLDINTAYARLKGIEQAVESEHWDLISLRSSHSSYPNLVLEHWVSHVADGLPLAGYSINPSCKVQSWFCRSYSFALLAGTVTLRCGTDLLWAGGKGVAALGSVERDGFCYLNWNTFVFDAFPVYPNWESPWLTLQVMQ